MDARRAQDLLKHITQDEDYGLKAMQKASLAECISMVNNVLPESVSYTHLTLPTIA